MLERDLYTPDNCIKFFPNFSVDRYRQCALSEQLIDSLALSPSYRKQIKECVEPSNIHVGILLISICFSLLRNQIPKARNISTRLGKFAWYGSILTIPLISFAIYQNTQLMSKSFRLYILEREQFQLAEETGDLQKVNHWINWADY